MGDADVSALDGVDLDIEAGEFVCVLGPSGSGKSTLMHILGCLDSPTSGEYRLDNRLVSSLSPDERARIRNREIGFVFQSFNLLPRTSAVDNVELPLLYADRPLGRRERQERARQAVASFGLEDRAEHHPNQLSGGQQQRVAIARALMNEPALLLADEPTGNLDSHTSIEIMELFQTLNAESGLTVVLITHERSVADFGTRRIELKDGRIEADHRLGSGDGRRLA